MSSKSTGSHLLVPDEEVKEYSEKLNSCYEMLHRDYSILINLPDSISTLKHLINDSHNIFYSIRDLLEDDFGIHPYTANELEVPECGHLLRQLMDWENDFNTAKNEYIRRQLNEDDAVMYPGEYASFWKDVRFTLWNVERCLRITRDRVKSNNELYPYNSSPPRYPWK